MMRKPFAAWMFPPALLWLGLSTSSHDAPPPARLARLLAPTAQTKSLVRTMEVDAAMVHIEHAKARRLAGKYARLAVHEAVKYHMPRLLVAAVISEETGKNPNQSSHLVSPAGAIGPMQLMPVTAWDVLRVNPWIPQENIAGGAAYLSRLIHEFHSLRLALIAYNAGPTAVATRAWPEASAVYAYTVLRRARISV